MIRHEETVRISSSGFDRVNRLLAIESLEEMTGDELLKLGANTNVCERVFHVVFDNGSYLNFDLCSGTNNYYDDVVWISADESFGIILDASTSLMISKLKSQTNSISSRL